MLREFRKHEILVTLVLDKDVARWLDNGTTRQGAERSHHGTVSQNLVAKGAAIATRITKNTTRPLVPDETVITLQHRKIFKDAKLHGSSRLLAAHAAMAPACQNWLSHNFSLKVSTHARPFANRLALFQLVARHLVFANSCMT